MLLQIHGRWKWKHRIELAKNEGVFQVFLKKLRAAISLYFGLSLQSIGPKRKICIINVRSIIKQKLEFCANLNLSSDSCSRYKSLKWIYQSFEFSQTVTSFWSCFERKIKSKAHLRFQFTCKYGNNISTVFGDLVVRKTSFTLFARYFMFPSWKFLLVPELRLE